MKALVTGATGFVGGHLVDLLLERGDIVTALVRSASRAAELERRGVQLIVGDLSNHDALAKCAGHDVVYHVAALTGAPDQAALMLANRDGTANLARACAAGRARPRFVLVSSMAAGGPTHRGAPKHADGHDHPVTMYGRSKLAAELVLRGEPLPWCILRPPTVYGPRDRENLLAVFKTARLGIAPTFGNGSMELSLIHVQDLAAAILHAGTVDATAHRIYYVNHPEVVTSAALVRAIGKEMGRNVTLLPLPEWLAKAALTATGFWANAFNRKSILHPDKVNEFYQEAWTADASAFVSDTGWAPKWGMVEGIADTVAWYRANGWL